MPPRSSRARAIRPRVGTRCCSIRSPVRQAASAPSASTSSAPAPTLKSCPRIQPASPQPPSVIRAIDPHHPALAPGELGVREQSPCLVEEKAEPQHQEPEPGPTRRAGPESSPPRRSAVIARGFHVR